MGDHAVCFDSCGFLFSFLCLFSTLCFILILLLLFQVFFCLFSVLFFLVLLLVSLLYSGCIRKGVEGLGYCFWKARVGNFHCLGILGYWIRELGSGEKKIWISLTNHGGQSGG